MFTLKMHLDLSFKHAQKATKISFIICGIFQQQKKCQKKLSPYSLTIRGMGEGMGWGGWMSSWGGCHIFNDFLWPWDRDTPPVVDALPKNVSFLSGMFLKRNI